MLELQRRRAGDCGKWRTVIRFKPPALAAVDDAVRALSLAAAESVEWRLITGPPHLVVAVWPHKDEGPGSVAPRPCPTQF